MKKIALPFCALFLSTLSFAQVEFGIQAGLNLSHTEDRLSNPTKKLISNSIPGINIGGFARFKIGVNAFIQPGLQYDQVGGEGVTEATNWVPAHPETQRFGYLSIPITIHYKSNAMKKFSLYGGMQLGFLVSEKLTATINGQTLSVDPNMHKDANFSLLLGLDYNFKMGIVIGLKSQLGISNVMSPKFLASGGYSANDVRRTINNFTISVGYILSKPKKQP